MLVIGGGGYTYPRWVDAFVPGARVEVVEIDPGVTEVAHADLGLAARHAHRLAQHGRPPVRARAGAARATTTIVVQDAVNDLSVPYHIMTREYNDAVRRLLAPDGVYMVSVIDLYQDGQLLPAVAADDRRGVPDRAAPLADPAWSSGGAGVFVVAGSERGVALDEVQPRARRHGRRSYELEPAALRAYVAAGDQSS